MGATETSATQRPLHGTVVLELSNFIAGPFTGALFADFGAEVLKIELPGHVDDSRRAGGPDAADPERSPHFAAGVGRGKKSVTLDVRVPAGRGLFLRLVEQADVLVENFRPGTLERWELGWPVLEAANPGLVLVRVSGYGQDGPWRDRPGFDRPAQAFSGHAYVTGHPDRPPVFAGATVADYTGGAYAFMGALLALHERDRSGRGQVVDAALYEAMLPALCEIPVRFSHLGEIRERAGNSYPRTPLMDVFATVDGKFLAVTAVGQRGFAGLMATIGRPELVDDPRYATDADRQDRRDELIEPVRAWVGATTRDAALDALGAAGVPASPVADIAEVMDHPHTRARGSFVTVDDPVYGALRAVGAVPRLSRTPGHVEHAGPALGAHTTEVLQDRLGLTDATLADLAAQGVV